MHLNHPEGLIKHAAGPSWVSELVDLRQSPIIHIFNMSPGGADIAGPVTILWEQLFPPLFPKKSCLYNSTLGVPGWLSQLSVPSAQVTIPGPWNGAPRQAPCPAQSPPLPLPLPAQLVMACTHSLKYIKSLKKKKFQSSAYWLPAHLLILWLRTIVPEAIDIYKNAKSC